MIQKWLGPAPLTRTALDANAVGPEEQNIAAHLGTGSYDRFMAQDKVEQLLAEQQAIEARRQELIEELLRQKEAAIKDFDEKLAQLRQKKNAAPKRSQRPKKSAAKKEASVPASL
jgi:hypothetical protein